MPLSYSDYLKLDDLLKLQKPLSEKEHDETLFIVIHQVYELWFKQILHEAELIKFSLAINKTTQVVATLKRILTILKTIVAQIDVLETITPLSFLSFRDRLESASGFQSIQFRELEIVLGKRSVHSLKHIPEGSKGRLDLERRLGEPSLYDSFLRFLKNNKFAVPQGVLDRDLTATQEESEEVQKILLEVYRTNPPIAQLCELLVDLDEGIQEWRYRHVKMVERTIGTKKGTGGSAGVQYLRSTLFQPLFPDLWAIRSEF
jgi:tryptophan 2,3-dioxygenase